MLETSFKHENMGPFGKKIKLGQYWLHAHFQKLANFSNVYLSLIFNPNRVFLDFLEILGCPLSNPFGFNSIGSSMFM